MAQSKSNNIVPIRGDRFGLYPHTVQQFNAYVPAGTPREDLVDRRMWAHVANSITTFAEIRVVSEDGAYYARLLVTYKNGSDLRLHELEFHELEALVDGSPNADFEVKSRGVVLKWCVVRKSDGVNIHEKLPTQAAALQALADYMKTLKIE